MVYYAEELAIKREIHKQLAWKTNIEVSSWSSKVEISFDISSWSPSKALTILLAKATCLDAVLGVTHYLCNVLCNNYYFCGNQVI